MFMTGFRCVACSTEQTADFDGYVCPACGGNLDVTYNHDAIAATIDPDNPFRSDRDDIFKYAPLLPLADPASSAPGLRIGATPLYHADRLGPSIGLQHVYIKDDGLNPSASYKDRASAVALARAREIAAPIVAGASTGNAGSSMACLAANAAVPCVIFVPEKAPAAKIAQLLIFGAHVMAVRGTYDDAFDLCLEFCNKHGWFNRNTGYNPFTREGKKTCSFEICEALQWQAPDWVVVPVGDGNIISGIWKGFLDLYAIKLIDRLPRLVCAQSTESDAITRAIRTLRKQYGDTTDIDWRSVSIPTVQATTCADSISVDMPRDGLAAVRAVIESRGEAVTVPDLDILSAIGELALKQGIFAEPAAATAWACLKKLAAEHRIEPDQRVVCLITGSGLKDIAAARKVAGEPTVIAPSLEAAEASLRPLLENR